MVLRTSTSIITTPNGSIIPASILYGEAGIYKPAAATNV